MDRFNESVHSGPDESGSSIMMVMLDVYMLPEAVHKKMNTAPPLSFALPTAKPNRPDPRLGEEQYTPESSVVEEAIEEEEEEHTEPLQDSNGGGTAAPTPNEEEREEKEEEEEEKEPVSTPPEEEPVLIAENEPEPEEQVILTDVQEDSPAPEGTPAHMHDKEVQQPEVSSLAEKDSFRPETGRSEDGLCSCPHDYTCARCGRFLNVSEPHNHDELPREPGPQTEVARPRPVSRKKVGPSEFAQDTELPQLQRSAVGGEGPRVIRRPAAQVEEKTVEQDEPQVNAEEEVDRMKVIQDDDPVDTADTEPVNERPPVIRRPVDDVRTVVSVCPHSFTCAHCGCVLNDSEPHDHDALPSEPGHPSELARPRPVSCKKIVPPEFLQDTELPRLQRSVEVRGGSAPSKCNSDDKTQQLQPHPPSAPREASKENPARRFEEIPAHEKTPSFEQDSTAEVEVQQDEEKQSVGNTPEEVEEPNEDMPEELVEENNMAADQEVVEMEPVSVTSENELLCSQVKTEEVEPLEPVALHEEKDLEERHYGGGPESRSEARISVNSNTNSAATVSSHSEKQQLAEEERHQLLEAEPKELGNGVLALNSNGASLRSLPEATADHEPNECSQHSPKQKDMCTQAGRHDLQKARNLPPPVFDSNCTANAAREEPSAPEEGSPSSAAQCGDSPCQRALNDEEAVKKDEAPAQDGEESFSSSYSYSSWSSYSMITPTPDRKEKSKKKGKHNAGKKRTGSRLPPIHRSRNARTGSKKNPRQASRHSSGKKKKSGKTSKGSGDGGVSELLMDSPYLQPVAPGSPGRTRITKGHGATKTSRISGSARRRGGDGKSAGTAGNGNQGQEESVSPHRAAGDTSVSSSQTDGSQRDSLPPLPDSSLPKSNDPYAQILGRKNFWGEGKYGVSR